ncbi:helix-turn-helix domain-containing protein [Corynebacterium incognita]|uniref:Helix-turn-helix domain-containing protein n=1 Tax=Corynebacterium incognita TaxID=2754725 RepID=A0A7G7CRS9_9CORY|nr:helix-turn-helix domain-containing protein [Corynebacterium incognita]QNE90295.1 helix-turn-helix domain-containing protein [Corynebacterium incognita]
MPEKRYMSVTTMADYYDLSKGFIRGHINAGNLPAVNISTNPGKPLYRIAVTDADEFMNHLADQADRAERKLLSA